MKVPTHRQAATTLAALALLLAGGASAADDPYLWLEEVSSAPALGWVRQHNQAALGELEKLAGFGPLRAAIGAVLDSKDRIPAIRKQGKFYYNFWKDGQHPRGVLRRATLAQYRRPSPAWDTVIDLDQLAASEHENWQWDGIDCLAPAAEKCLVSLTRGGGDTHVVREFDMRRRRFVEGGFVLPEAKSDVSWIDQDRLLVATDFGAGSLTDSGYPRMVKEWRRGTPLATARLVHEGKPGDTSVSAWREQVPGFRHQFVIRWTSFFTNELLLRDGDQLVRIDKPGDANAFTVREQLFLQLRSAWTVGGASYAQGALLAIDLRKFLAGARRFEVLFSPTPSSSLQSIAHTRHALLLTEMDHVRSRLVELRQVRGEWRRRVVATPSFATLSVAAADPLHSDAYFLTTTDFLTPPTLHLGQVGKDTREVLKSMPALYDAAGLKVEQHYASARDGTRIPYFVVMRNDAVLDGSNPTLLYGYGGFESSMKPGYSALLGRAWLAKGGIYVLSNIRGGGEYGPRWHQAALKEKRQVSYDDFATVAEDLIARKISSPRHLGIMGGSLGGMLVSVAMLQRPELFNAVVSQVPLTDMQRYHKLLAGASWIDEYGDPDQPAQWDYIARYSPYHNVAKGKAYPAVFYTSSTRDDRVHPAHARKMVARLEELGHDVRYWENMEGGHGGAVNSDQQAQLYGMIYAFLWDKLK
jgi:prolyl oligopeptidase